MDIKEQYDLWDSFLQRWPREKLNEMTLEQYISVDDKDTFTYWLETKTRELGSIQGNTSAKFGIYKRSGKPKEQSGIEHGAIYSWRTRYDKYGVTQEGVFKYVKEVITSVAKAAYEGDLDSIEKIDFSPLVKWKIAFLYLNRQSPILINTFSKEMLQVLVDENGDQTYTELYQALIKEKGNKDLLAFGMECWDKANSKKQAIANRELLSHFLHIQQFKKYYHNWPMDVRDNFCNLIREAKKQKLDVFTTNMESGDVIRLGRKDLNIEQAKSVFAGITPQQDSIKFEQRYEHRDKYLTSPVTDKLINSIVHSKVLSRYADEFPIDRDSYLPKDYLADGLETVDSDAIGIEGNDVMNKIIPLNQILFGPPGTGKTYHTIEAAVNAAEPTFTWADRDELKAKYDVLVNEKRIRFVTFHQSFGYEEFVEGIKPDVSDSDAICYSVESGIFKQICEDATLSVLPNNSSINKDGRVWKISIEGAHPNKTKEYCLKENIAAIGWCDTGDLSLPEKNQYFQELGKNDQNSLLYFCQEMMEGDLIVCIDSSTSIEAVGVIIGPYQYISTGLPVREDYTHQRRVQWLQQGFTVDLKELNDNKRFSLPTCYPLDRMSVSDVLRHLEASNVFLPDIQQAAQKQNYVLVIDEINRGNISKIFGELITLIEPSKREGNDEALKLSLPYSGKPFSVPNNLYIIGTMNTADRSLTMLDTALRRRFDFVEMMPDPEILENAAVKGIDLTQLLTTLNQRIEVLYYREHTLGHAFFIPVKEAIAESEDIAFQKLIGVFQNKIIPLLQEYFFEDWQKIRLVLGDNQKPAVLQFVTEEKQTDSDLETLFGKSHGLNQYGDEQCRYGLKPLDDAAWRNKAAYVAIYDITAALTMSVNQQNTNLDTDTGDAS